MKPSDVASVRMERMGLASPVFQGPVQVVHGHLAMQAQDYSPAKWSIAQRLSGVADVQIEGKVSGGSILRTHVLRPTWHFVARQDLRWLMALSGPRVQRGQEPRYRQLGLDPKTRSRAEKLFSDGLEGGNHLTRAELGEILRRSGIQPTGQRLPHLLMHCELESVICSGSLRGKDHTYALFDERVPAGRHLNRDQAVTELVRRYLTSHGPATLKDMSWWSGLKTTDLRAGVEALGSRLSNERVKDSNLWWIGEPRPSLRRGAVVQLLQAYDEYVVGYTESRYLGDPRGARVRAAFADRSLPSGTVMSGPRVAGHWRRSTTDKAVRVEVLLYEPLSKSGGLALERAVGRLGDFLGRRTQLWATVI